MTFTLAIPIAFVLGGIILPQGTAGDCNSNGIPDSTEIASTPHLDTNGNGMPDSCEGLSVDVDRIPLATGGTQRLQLDLGPAMAGTTYWIFGSLAGSDPGMQVGFARLPLNYDGPGAYMAHTLWSPNQGYLAGGLSALDSQGRATAVFTVPPGMDPSFAGMKVHHAYMILGANNQTFVWASNAVSAVLE